MRRIITLIVVALVMAAMMVAMAMPAFAAPNANASGEAKFLSTFREGGGEVGPATSGTCKNRSGETSCGKEIKGRAQS